MKKNAIYIMLGMLFLMVSCTKNSLNIIEYPVKSDPTIAFKIVFTVGSAHDPEGKEGLAYLTARMLTDGSTQKLTYSEILDQLYPMAASYSSQVDKEVTTISGRVHSDNVDKYIELLTDAIISPAFDETDFNRIKNETISYLESTLRYSSDEELGKAALYSFIFKNTPYAHPVQGYVSSLKSITLKDIQNFYQQHYNQSNLIVGIGGGYTQSTLSDLSDRLRQFPVGTATAVPQVSPEPIDGLHVLIVEKPNAQSTAISFGHPLELLRGNPDWYALDVARSWLGEHRNSSSHLYQVIREARGLNYGDYAYIEHFPRGGYRQFPPTNIVRHAQIFEIWIRPVPNYARHFALRAAMAELNKLISEGLSKDEFELTKQFLSNYILNYAPTTSMKLGYRIDDYLYGIKGHHLDLYKTHLNKMNIEETNSAIKRYLNDKHMKIVFVTSDAKQLAQDLVSNTPSPIQYKEPKPKSVMDEDKLFSTYRLNISPDNIQIVPVDKIFE
ncbi:MAG: pitrilysin family protein [Calditrichia bacterium]